MLRWWNRQSLAWRKGVGFGFLLGVELWMTVQLIKYFIGE